MPPPMPNPILMSTEILFSVIIIILCLIIYFKTKEISELSGHKGIEYFRKSFIFFGAAYAFRFIGMLTVLSLPFLNLFRGLRINHLILIFVGFFGTMAILSLFLSLSWKRFKTKHIDKVSYIIAILISLLSFLTREPLILVASQLLLMIITSILIFKMHKKSSKFSKLFGIYILLLVFWLAGLMHLGSRWFLPLESLFLIQGISLLIFIIVFYKVNKWIR